MECQKCGSEIGNARVCGCGWRRRNPDNPADLHANSHIQCAFDGCMKSAMVKKLTPTGWVKLCYLHADRMRMDEAHANLDKYGLAKEPDETTAEHTARMREFFRNSFRNFKSNLTRKAA